MTSARSGVGTPTADLADFLVSLRRPALLRFFEAIRSETTVGAVDIHSQAPLPSAPQTTTFVRSEELSTRLSEAATTEPKELKPLPVKVETSMDPRLQLAVANGRMGKSAPALTSTVEGELPVVARVKSVEAWRELPGVLAGADLGKTENGSHVVTGRIPVRRIETIRKHSTVISLKASQTIQPTLAATIKEMGVSAADLPKGTSPDGGAGIVVGVVDFGCDFAHKNFRLGNGKTRLLKIWHQAGVARVDSPFGYGRVYSQTEIDAALRTSSPYSALGYGPPVDSKGRQGTHGTHVMDIAAGNGLGSGQAGVAPKADLIFVELSANDIAWQGPDVLYQTFGDSVQLLEAVRFVFDQAGDKPCVCNLSLGTNGGPHDGTSPVELGLDSIVNEKPNRAIVIAASNSQTDGIHASGQVPAKGIQEIEWQQQGTGGGEIDLWYASTAQLEVSLVGPDGTTYGPVQPGANASYGTPGAISVFISSRIGDPNNNDNVIGLWIAEGLSGNNWKIRLTSITGAPADYHAWIERNDNAQASFILPVDTHTLGSISTGHDSIVVGSFDAHKSSLPISDFSSAGPTRDGRNKPEVSAPGQYVIAARSRTTDGITRKSGTSMAAPAVAGLIALIFAEAARVKKDLTIADLRKKLMSTAQKNPPSGPQGTWDSRYGFGRAKGASIKP